MASLSHRYGVSETTLYKWRTKFAGMEVLAAKRLRELERKNRNLKRLLADRKLELAAE